MEAKNPIQSADRIFTILEILAENGAMRLIDISEKLELHKSTVHRLLASLISMGYVNQDGQTGVYSLTYKIVELSSRLLKNTDIITVIHPYAKQLTEQCDETVHFVERVEESVLYLEKLESKSVKTRSIRMASQVGVTRPMYCSAVGKAILAELSEDEIKRIWNSSIIEKKTQYTITTLPAMLEELKSIKRQGYAVDNEENELGIRCVAVSVSDYRNEPRYAMSISTLTSRMSDERLAELARMLKETKKKLIATLGSSISME